MKIFLWYSTILVFSLECVCAHRILGLFSVQAYSHFVMYQRLMIGLVERGHEVDVLSHFPLKKPIQGYTDLSVAGSVRDFVNALNVSILDNWSLRKNLELEVEHCEIILNTPTAKNLKNSTKKYDLVITEIFGSDCMVGFAHFFKAPLISMSSSVILPWGNDRIGNPDNPSFIPNYLVPFTSQMSLKERLFNAATLIYSKMIYYWYSTKTVDFICRNFFGPNLPSLEDLIRNTSLVLVNSHFSLTGARPTVPNFVEVGGLHIGPIKELPKEILDVINGDQKDVVYFSMGSMVMTESFPRDKLKALLSAFSRVPYKILWKADKKRLPPNVPIPENVHFEKWLPQLDVLCHPKVKLFITHGGLMGLQEAVYCGVPSLGIPLFDDQGQNVAHLMSKGVALKVPYEDLSEENLLKSMKKLLEDTKVYENAQTLSKLFKDRPNSALETAIYWIEYVVSHKGAPHLRSRGADLIWYQYHLVDVIFVAILPVVFLVATVYLISLFIVKKSKKIKLKKS